MAGARADQTSAAAGPAPPRPRASAREGVPSDPQRQTAPSLEPSWPRWEQHRHLLAQELGEQAAVALTKVADSLRAGQGRDAKDFATTLGILIDKAQLLAADITAHGVQPNGTGTIDSEIRQLMDELEAGRPDGG
jgi:hypothetical protein